MTLAEYKAQVQAQFYVPFADALVADRVDAILQRGLKKCFSRAEVVRSIEVSASTELPEAQSVTKVSKSVIGAKVDVFYYLFPDRTTKSNMNWYFSPERRLIIETNFLSTLYVEYVVDPKFLKIEDLNASYIEWVVEYGKSLVEIEEAMEGLNGTNNSLPFEYNYTTMLDNAREDKLRLEEDLEDMSWGLFAAKD